MVPTIERSNSPTIRGIIRARPRNSRTASEPKIVWKVAVVKKSGLSQNANTTISTPQATTTPKRSENPCIWLRPILWRRETSTAATQAFRSCRAIRPAAAWRRDLAPRLAVAPSTGANNGADTPDGIGAGIYPTIPERAIPAFALIIV